MARIRYVKGDATQPQAKGIRIIAHVCKNLGGWGTGFVVALPKRQSEPEAVYRTWHKDPAKNGFGLGAILVVQVDPHIWVANRVAQRGMKSGSNGPPIRYEAVRGCLKKLVAEAKRLGASVPMPRIGCGLAGGQWEAIELIILDELVSPGIDVTVYDLG